MPTAEARIETERPSRYLTQLSQHIGHMSDKGRQLRHRPGAPHTDDERAREEVRITIVEASDTHAMVDFAPWGQFTMRATPNLLTISVEATDGENLRRLQDVLTRNLTRFGRRDHLEVNWQGPDTGAEPESTKPRRRWALVLGIIGIKLAIIAAILVLPSGLALSLGASHGVALLVLLVVAAVTLLVHKLRGKSLPPVLSMVKHKTRR